MFTIITTILSAHIQLHHKRTWHLNRIQGSRSEEDRCDQSTVTNDDGMWQQLMWEKVQRWAHCSLTGDPHCWLQTQDLASCTCRTLWVWSGRTSMTSLQGYRNCRCCGFGVRLHTSYTINIFSAWDIQGTKTTKYRHVECNQESKWINKLWRVIYHVI